MMTLHKVSRSQSMKKTLTYQDGCPKESCIRSSRIVFVRGIKRIWNVEKHTMRVWEEMCIFTMNGKNAQSLDRFRGKNFMIHVIILEEISRESYRNLMISND